MLDLAATGLPLAPRLGEVSAILMESGALVLAAEPGAGKTSLVPLYLSQAIPGRILVLEPRRLAAVSAAARMSELARDRPGGLVGYRVRLESRIGPSTRIEVLTEGVLVRMAQEDPELRGVGLVVFDEFHERSVHADLGLALAMEARALRPELRLLVMSATLDTERIAGHLGAPVLAVAGRSHPVETRYADVGSGPGFEDALAALAEKLASDIAGSRGRSQSEAGDLLVFLPGAAEIGRAARALAGSPFEIHTLHGSMPLSAQRRVILPRPGAPRRIVLSTSLAETSLTVPRVGAVLDSGLARLSRFHVRSGMNRLVTEREAADRAEQRRGRAGRLGPGLCLRAWSAAESLPERSQPEILRSELSSLALEAALRGAGKRESLPWLDLPPEAAWETARELLGELGALDGSGTVTAFGRRMAAMGTEPRLAALVLRGAESSRGGEACLLAALLSSREPSSGDKDLDLRLEELVAMELEPAGSHIAFEARALARSAGINIAAGPPAEKEERETADRSGIGSLLAARGVGSLLAARGVGSLLAAAYPDRIGKRIESRGTEASFRLVTGRSVRATGSLAAAAWIVAAEADAGAAEGRVYSGAALDEGSAIELLEPLATESLELEWRGMGYRARTLRKAGAILLSETAAGALPLREVQAALARRLRDEGLVILPWGEGIASPGAFLSRLRWWASRSEPALLARFEEAALVEAQADWLCPFAEASPAGVLGERSLRLALESLLDRPTRLRLDSEAPAALELPSGSTRPIEYPREGDPSLEARVQELFGLSSQPRVCGRPLVLRLLTPAHRPLQVTSDLPGFWKGEWIEARKELRGRYPKHEWPEDPAAARPSRSGLKRRNKL